MTNASLSTIIITAISTGVVLLVVKIIWDFLTKRNDCIGCEVKNEVATIQKDIIKIKMDMESFTIKMESFTTKIDKLTNFIMGNGDIDKSLAYRMANIESFIRDIKQKKYSRSL